MTIVSSVAALLFPFEASCRSLTDKALNSDMTPLMELRGSPSVTTGLMVSRTPKSSSIFLGNGPSSSRAMRKMKATLCSTSAFFWPDRAASRSATAARRTST